MIGAGWRLLVVDGDGTVVAMSARWELEQAHRWAHARAVEPLTVLPVRIEDLGLRLTWVVDRDSCRFTAWVALPAGSSGRLGCPLTTAGRGIE